MVKKYIKHDRDVTTEQLQQYGKYATHDIHVPILLLYPAGDTKDKNGTAVKIDDKFIEFTKNATNNAIKKKFNAPLAKVKSFYANTIGDYEIIPIIKNHDTSNVDGVVGHTKGLAYIQKIEGINCLLIDSVIKDPETKSKIEGDLFRNTSLGTRGDGSIKEISIVSNEALAHGGFLMSEPTVNHCQEDNILINKPQISKEELLLTEEIQELQLAEEQLNHVTIPNHMILSRMIKNGKIEPWKYDGLISQSTKTIQLMEQSLPSNHLGIIYGTTIQPKKIETDTTDKLINDMNKIYKQISGKELNLKKDKKQSQQELHAIQKPILSFEEERQKELKHILELAEYSPEIAKQYVKCELGESIEAPISNDKYLTDYLKQLQEIKEKINNLNIQLGELEHE